MSREDGRNSKILTRGGAQQVGLRNQVCKQAPAAQIKAVLQSREVYCNAETAYNAFWQCVMLLTLSPLVPVPVITYHPSPIHHSPMELPDRGGGQ
jgi:hypothetical protein